MRRFRRPVPETEIPTSSMPDIAFLMVIYFMLTTVFMSTRGLDFAVPEEPPADAAPDPVQPIVVHVQPAGLAVDCEPVAEDRLVERVAGRLGRVADRTVVVYVDPAASYQRMIAAYDRLVDAASPGAPLQHVELHVPFRTDVDDYRETFGENPFTAHCR